MSQTEAIPQTLPRDRAFGIAGPWRGGLALAALVAVAIALRHWLAANTDVSWLLTCAERVIDGGRLYADIIETNPPMAVLVYIPGVLLARALGCPAETVTDALVFAAILVSLAATASILRRSAARRGVPGWPLGLLGFFVLAILPMQTFGQREHIALIGLLPMLAVIALRAQGEAPPRWAVVTAGLGAGVALAFKPYFAIGLGCGLGALAVQARAWRGLVAPENVIAAAFGALYLVGVTLLFPEFFSVIGPMVRDVYLPVGLPFEALLAKPAVPLWAILTLAILALRRRGGIDATLLLLLASSAGFALAFLAQRKGWPYHSYPMLTLALLGLGQALLSPARPAPGRALRIGVVLVLAVVAVRAMLWFDVAFDARPLRQAVSRLGPRPAILAITGEPGIGHPLVRALGGTWVSRQQGLWIATYLEFMRRDGPLGPARDAMLDAYAARERAMLIEDIRIRPPTVVLVDDLTGAGSAWLRAHPDIAALLADFVAVETVNNVAILARR
jgi:hypothetical protein